MSDGLSDSTVKKKDRNQVRLYRVCESGLVAAVERNGGELLGLSAKLSEWETLVTLRAEFPAGRMIAFVGGDSLATALLKAWSEANNDKLKWREDRYAR